MRRARVTLASLVAALVCTLLVSVGLAGSSSGAGSIRKLPAVILSGDGSTFQLPYTQAVLSAFKQRQPLVTVSYEGVGSAHGLADFASQRVDFAGADTMFTPEASAAAKGGPFFYFPTVVAPITLAYNVPGVSDLRLSANTIAEIFEGEITTWDSVTIAEENPNRSLPSIPIVVAHRTDGSGTTQNFTQFLSEAAPGSWTLGTGATVNWPVDSQGGAGDFGVAQIVQTTEGGIGYVDYADAHAMALTSASIENVTGRFVAPTPESAAAALVGVLMNRDLTLDPINAAAPDAYPITAATWLVVSRCQPDPRKADALKALLQFVYTTGRQSAEDTGFVPLTRRFVKAAKAQIQEIVTTPC